MIKKAAANLYAAISSRRDPAPVANLALKSIKRMIPGLESLKTTVGWYVDVPTSDGATKVLDEFEDVHQNLKIIIEDLGFTMDRVCEIGLKIAPNSPSLNTARTPLDCIDLMITTSTLLLFEIDSNIPRVVCLINCAQLYNQLAKFFLLLRDVTNDESVSN